MERLLCGLSMGFGCPPEISGEQPQIPALQVPSCAFNINLLNRAPE